MYVELQLEAFLEDNISETCAFLFVHILLHICERTF